MRPIATILVLALAAACGGGGETPKSAVSKEPVSVRGWIEDVEGSVKSTSPEMEIARRTQVFQGTQIWVENADYVSGGVAENGSFILLDVPPGNVTIGFSAPGVDRAKIVMTNIPGSADVFIPRVILKPNGASVVKPESVVVRIASPEIKKPAPTGKTATVAGLTVPIMNVPLSAMVDRHDYPVPEGFRPLVVVK